MLTTCMNVLLCRCLNFKARVDKQDSNSIQLQINTKVFKLLNNLFPWYQTCIYTRCSWESLNMWHQCYYCVYVNKCSVWLLPAVCRGMVATHSLPSPDTIQSGHGRCQWFSGTTPRSRRNPTRKWPTRKHRQHHNKVSMNWAVYWRTEQCPPSPWASTFNI